MTPRGGDDRPNRMRPRNGTPISRTGQIPIRFSSLEALPCRESTV